MPAVRPAGTGWEVRGRSWKDGARIGFVRSAVRGQDGAQFRAMPARPRSPQAPTHDLVDLIAARFKVLGEPNRLRLLNALKAGEKSVSELVSETGTTQPNVSRHLQALADAGLVHRRKEGVAVYYGIAEAQVFELCEHVCGSLRRRLQIQARSAEVLRRHVASRRR